MCIRDSSILRRNRNTRRLNRVQWIVPTIQMCIRDREELSLKSGVVLRFVRDLEQGKETRRLEKVNQLLEDVYKRQVHERVVVTAFDRSLDIAFVDGHRPVSYTHLG